MPSEYKDRLIALVNSKAFIGPDDITNGYQEIWGPNVQGTSWFNSFIDWYNVNYSALEICERSGSTITLVVV